MMRRQQSGFTLIELSVVLVIIGLIAGAIFVGENMIRQAQLRGMVTEVLYYKRAISEFKDRYMALPGDFSNATGIWGAASSCPNGAGTGTQTCNGNGDGHIGDRTTGNTAYEAYRAWQHLVNAGFIQGSYTGVVGPQGVFNDLIGINIPASKVAGAGYVIVWADASSAGIMFPAMLNHHNLHLGQADNGALGYRNYSADAPALTTQEAQQVDIKIDDGFAGSGTMESWMHSSANPNCTTDNVNYDLTQTGLQCGIDFDLGL